MFGKRRREEDWDDMRRPDGRHDHDRRGEGHADDAREGGWGRGGGPRDDGRGAGPWGAPADRVDLWHGAGRGDSYQVNAAPAADDWMRDDPRAFRGGVPPWEDAEEPAPGDAQGRAGRDYPDAGFGDGGYGRAGRRPHAGYDAAPRNDASRNSPPRNGSAQDGGWHEDDAYRGPTFTEAPRNGEYDRVPSFHPAAPKFSPAADGALAAHRPGRDSRPYGRLSIFTLLDEKEAEFDRLARRAAEGVQESEPGTLAYVIHAVPEVPAQRIIYEIYRDRSAFESHERQPHILKFAGERKACVLAVNIIDLRPEFANMVLPGTASPSGPAAAPGSVTSSQAARPLEPASRANGDGRYPDAGLGRPANEVGPGYVRAGNRWGTEPGDGQYRDAGNAGNFGGRWLGEDWDQPRGPGQRDRRD